MAVLGEILPFAWAGIPRGWALCDGSVLSIASYPALFSLLGTTYGGDGRETFGLPDLRGRAVMGSGTGPHGAFHPLGELLGIESVQLGLSNIPPHTHQALASDKTGNWQRPDGGLYAEVGAVGSKTPLPIYGPSTQPTALAESTVEGTGGEAPVDMMQPFAVVNYCIAVLGEYPIPAGQADVSNRTIDPAEG